MRHQARSRRAAVRTPLPLSSAHSPLPTSTPPITQGRTALSTGPSARQVLWCRSDPRAQHVHLVQRPEGRPADWGRGKRGGPADRRAPHRPGRLRRAGRRECTLAAGPPSRDESGGSGGDGRRPGGQHTDGGCGQTHPGQHSPGGRPCGACVHGLNKQARGWEHSRICDIKGKTTCRRLGPSQQEPGLPGKVGGSVMGRKNTRSERGTCSMQDSGKQKA